MRRWPRASSCRSSSPICAGREARFRSFSIRRVSVGSRWCVARAQLRRPRRSSGSAPSVWHGYPGSAHWAPVCLAPSVHGCAFCAITGHGRSPQSSTTRSDMPVAASRWHRDWRKRCRRSHPPSSSIGRPRPRRISPLAIRKREASPGTRCSQRRMHGSPTSPRRPEATATGRSTRRSARFIEASSPKPSMTSTGDRSRRPMDDAIGGSCPVMTSPNGVRPSRIR